jgi:ADP-heptose:LPS heptosyltransferase
MAAGKMPRVPKEAAVRPLDPDRMRRADRWIGIPACFLLTLWSRLFRRRNPAVPNANVLFIELAEMGTTVIACPAIRRLQEIRPDAKVYFLLLKQIEASIRVLDIVPDAHVLTIDASSPWTVLRDTVRFMRNARRLNIDTVINLEAFTRFTAMIGYLSGAATRVGFHRFHQEGLYIGDLFTHRVQYNPHLHTWQSLTTLVNALDAPADELPVGKFPAPAADAYAVPRIRHPELQPRLRQLLGAYAPAQDRRLIVINPNASKLITIRKWPLERYAELAARLLEDPRHACVLTGVASELDDAEFIRQRVRNERLVILTGKTSLAELIELYNMADVLVTNDSGPAHFAALTDIDVVVFFGPETPKLYGPMTRRATVLYSDYACSPCVSAFNQRRSPCTDNRCLQAISVESVHRTILNVLNSRQR